MNHTQIIVCFDTFKQPLLCPLYLSPALSLCLLAATDLVSGLLGFSVQFLGGEKLHLSLLADLCLPPTSPAAGGWPCPAPSD